MRELVNQKRAAYGTILGVKRMIVPEMTITKINVSPIKPTIRLDLQYFFMHL